MWFVLEFTYMEKSCRLYFETDINILYVKALMTMQITV